MDTSHGNKSIGNSEIQPGFATIPHVPTSWPLNRHSHNLSILAALVTVAGILYLNLTVGHVMHGPSLQFSITDYRGFPFWFQSWPANRSMYPSSIFPIGSSVNTANMPTAFSPREVSSSEFYLLGCAVDILVSFAVVAIVFMLSGWMTNRLSSFISHRGFSGSGRAPEPERGDKIEDAGKGQVGEKR